MNRIYLFDVDGTLTPSRGKIDPVFAEYMSQLTENHTVGYVTGSDKDKTIEQIGKHLFDAADYSFNCLGNVIYKKGICVYKTDWRLSNELREALESMLSNSLYTEKYGNHIEERIGMVNFSIVGRNAVGDQRKRYYEWDYINNERITLAKEIKSQFDGVDAVVGGETGIDIAPIGCDKAQVLKELTDFSEILFFGDRMDKEGNDYSLAKAIKDNNRGQCYHVKNWQETMDLLQKEMCI